MSRQQEGVAAAPEASTQTQVDRVILNGQLTGWAAMAQAVRKHDEEKIDDCKDDINTLLVLVRPTVFTATSAANLSDVVGRFILCCSHRIYRRVLQDAPGGSSTHNSYRSEANRSANVELQLTGRIAERNGPTYRRTSPISTHVRRHSRKRLVVCEPRPQLDNSVTRDAREAVAS